MTKKIILALFLIVFVLVAGFLFFWQKETEEVIKESKDLDVLCGIAGAEGYQLELFDYDIPEIPLERGRVITVTNDSDVINGDVSNLEALLKNPGPGGVSLREAMEVTQRDPGEYTIKFAEHLKGATVNIGSWDRKPLPIFNEGNIIINGDITNNNKPDITINNYDIFGDKAIAFQISSSNNVLHALKIENFTIGVAFISSNHRKMVFANNIISNLTLKDIHKNGILLSSYVPRPLPEETIRTGNKWINTLIIGNEIEAVLGGINFLIHFLAEETIENTKIVNNKVFLEGARFSEGISLTAGLWGGANNNRITDTLIADNFITIKGADDSMGIRVGVGDNGASNNFIDNVIILNNQIEMLLGDNDKPTGMGIFLAAGDGSTIHDDPDLRPIYYPENNVFQNAQVLNNKIKGFALYGIFMTSGFMGAKYNHIKDISVLGNIIDITPSYVRYLGRPGGVGVYSGPFPGTREDFGGSRSSSENITSDIVIKLNTIKLAEPYSSFDHNVPGVPFPGDPEGIIVYGTRYNEIQEVYLLNNLLIGKGVSTDPEERVKTECNQVEK